EDWEDLDSVACILALLEQLTNQSGAEISRGGLFAQLPAAQALDLFGIRPSTSATVLPQNGKPSPRPTVADLEALQAQLRPFAPLFQRAQLVSGNDLRTGDGLAGSNNWVVAPSAAAGDDALFANDPHLALTNPSIWFLVNLDSAEGLHVAGASFAGLPDVILGHNENIAWGATVAFFDMADVYLEQLAPDGSGVVFNGQVVPFITRQFTIEVSGGAPVTRTALYVPHHGPVVALDAMAGTALTIKWTGQDADTDLDFLFEMSKAASVDEAQVALRKVTTVGQNFVVADRTGNIGWFPYNRVPNRPWAVATPSWLPLSGDGSFEWMGSVPIEMLPQSKNPAQGYIATANNDMTGALADGNNANEGQAALQHFVAAGYRQASILDRLSSGAGQHDLASMQTIQGDVKSGVGEDIVPAILQAVSGRTLSANAQAVADALTAWDFECPTGLDGIDPMTSNPTADMAVRGSATGCAAFHVLFPRLYAAIFDDELGAAGVDSLPTTAALTDAIVRPGRLLGGTYFDDVSTASVTETAGDVFEAAMDSAGMYLTTTLGASSSDWLWGRLHTVTLRADLFDAVGIPFFNQGPYANDGGLFTIDVANTQSATEDLYDHRSGASMRFACALGASGVRCTMELPGGQAHFADTPTPQGTLQEYLTNQPFELVFDEATAESTAVQRWTIMGN
ncbi:MAG: penicillin acylase family protein, partial [Myxococcota bacterium]